MNTDLADTFIPRLLDDDEDTRYQAAREFARLGREAIPQAIEWTAAPSPRLREMACYVLGQAAAPGSGRDWHRRPYPDGVPTLRTVLHEDADDWVRSCAAAALSFHAATDAIADLVTAAGDESAEVRRQVAYALGSYYGSNWDDTNIEHKPSVTEALLRMMDDEDDDVRDWATFGIHQGDHDTPETRARLWRALDDPNPDVQGEAAAGLACFGDRSLIPRLSHMLRTDDHMNPCLFEASREFNDPALLPSVLQGARNWIEHLDDGEKLHFYVTWAIHTLRRTAGRARRPIALHHARLRRRHQTTNRRH